MNINKVRGLMVIILATIIGHVSLFSAEPPCPFTDPCADNARWEERELIYAVPGCTGCQITLTYLAFESYSCPNDNGGTYILFAYYLEGISFSPICYPNCFSSYEEMFTFGFQIFNDAVLQPAIAAAGQNSVVEFKAKSCWKLEDLLYTGPPVSFLPCEDLLGCCAYRYSFGPAPHLCYWLEMDGLSPCDDYSIPYHANDCFAACGYFADVLLPAGGLGKISVSNSTEFIISPNPGRDEVNVLIPEDMTTAYEVKIVDMEGKVLINQQCVNNTRNTKINTSNLSNGSYILTIYQNDTILHSAKIVIIR